MTLTNKLVELADAWKRHVEATERMNAAIPDVLTSTPAERALYDERYKARGVAEREMRNAATSFAQWCAENDAAASVATLRERVAQAEKVVEPFATWAADNVGEEGWEGLGCQRERIVDWFCSSDFRAATQWLDQGRKEGV